MTAFLLSQEADWYEASCREFGVDPGAIFDDEWMGLQMRVGLLARPRPEPEMPDAPDDVAERDRLRAQQAREGARRIDAQMAG